MDVRSCRGCGKLYNYLGANTPVCPACMKKMEEKFEVCKKYIRDNPGANIQTVSDETEVSVKMIKQWVREERLSFAEDSAVGVECESCGVMIRTGRFCNNCKGKLNESFINASRKPIKQNEDNKQRRDQAKMRFLDN